MNRTTGPSWLNHPAFIPRGLLFVTLLAGLMSCACASATPTPSHASGAPSAQEVAALKDELQRFLNQQAADWTRGDLEAFCAVYAQDAVFISPSGKTVGRKAIFDRYTKRYRDDGAQMGSLTLSIEDIRIGPSGEMASITLRWTLTWPSKAPASGR